MTAERTYRREDLEEATRRWSEGAFDEAWQPYRAAAAARGFIFPPDGSRDDSVEDPQPSQRAIVWRAIEDTPRLLMATIRRSSSWNDVVRLLIAELDRRRVDAGFEELAISNERASHPTRRQAAERVGALLDRLR